MLQAPEPPMIQRLKVEEESPARVAPPPAHKDHLFRERRLLLKWWHFFKYFFVVSYPGREVLLKVEAYFYVEVILGVAAGAHMEATVEHW